MKSQIDYRIKAQIKGEEPDIQLEVIFKDYFSNDHYIIKTTKTEESNINNIPFVVYKNGKQIVQTNLVNKDTNKFIDEFVSSTEDDDFSREFKSNIHDNLIKELNNFFEFFDEAIILKGITLEGEKFRMKKIAGIVKS